MPGTDIVNQGRQELCVYGVAAKSNIPHNDWQGATCQSRNMHLEVDVSLASRGASGVISHKNDRFDLAENLPVGQKCGLQIPFFKKVGAKKKGTK